MTRAKKAPAREPKPATAAAAESVLPPADPGAPVATPLIVAIGASAGGLEAYKRFFDHMPADSDMAFVLVQHLAPDHNSMLVDLLSRHTRMPVAEATDGVQLEARHVYVIPPDATLTIADGLLQLSKPAPPRQYRWPIDTFFISLAEDQGDNAVAIVLSGSGSDGARGLTAVKERGGLALAQAGTDHAAMSGMPASAAATGLVDHVLPVEEMPARLLAHHRHLVASRGKNGPDGAREDLKTHLQTISALLRAEVGHDFSQYKEKTLIRRIQRRMQVAQTDTVAAYIEHLRETPRELENLFRELLIGVTEFFRDPEAFAALQMQAIPALLADKTAADPLRVWVPACATGEEAYSVAIALAEAVGQRRSGPKIQIFATDIDDRAIAAARAGRFRAPLPGVSPERLERWFIQEGDYYVVVKPIREMVVFSPHSAIKDPPFSRLDFISCRNLLIYLNAELQDHLIRTFHYALRPGGILMLGPSESLGRNTPLFTVLDKKHRLYTHRSDGRNALPQIAPRRLADAAARVGPATGAGGIDDAIDRHARRAMERHAPAYVVVDGNHDVLRFSGDTGRYLGPSSGTASLNLFSLLHKGLRAPARTALQQALSRRSSVMHEGQIIGAEGERIPVRLVAEPVFGQGEADGERPGNAALCLLMFKEATLSATIAPEPATAPRTGGASAKARAASVDASRVQELELELATTREQLHSAIDDLETANEEMKSANEEYQSVNEELQSSNEELETSKEEMQSINEELQTVNTELNSKNEVLARLNSDLQNLLESTQIATLFLDSSLHVTGFTPAVSDLFHLREGDQGRPITEITARIPYPQLRQDVKQVLRTLAMVERVLPGGVDGAVYLLRMRPYRTIDNVIDGVVLTFIDITERQQHAYERARLAAIIDTSQDAVIGHSVDGSIHSWNSGAERLLGHAATRVLGKSLAILLPPEEQDALTQLLAASAGQLHTEELQMTWLHRDGHRIPVSVRCSPVLGPSGEVEGSSTIARDTSDRVRIARRLGESEARLASIVEQTTMGVAQVDLAGRFQQANPRYCEIVGRSVENLQATSMLEITHPDDVPGNEKLFRALVTEGTPFQIEKRYLRPDGTPVWVSSHVSGISDDNGRPVGAVSVVLDITERKRASDHRELLMHELNHRVKNSLATVQAIAMQTLAHSGDVDTFRDAFLSRLQALSNTHNLLSQDNWKGVALREIVASELAPYAIEGRVRADINGERVKLDTRAALALSLALHELATNAGKYGALSVPQGRVRVEWKRATGADGELELQLHWSEHDGPAVVPPARRGFGSRLVVDGIAHELAGTVALDFPVTGAVCTIRLPLAHAEAKE